MSVTMTDASLPFIVIASSNGHKVPKEARTTIRKQAMKDVGLARKKRGNYGRDNMRTEPDEASDLIRTAVARVSRSDSSTVSSRGSPISRSSRTLSEQWVESDDFFPRGSRESDCSYAANGSIGFDFVYASMSPLPEYEQAKSKFGVDLASLSILTNFNVGKSTIAILSADPTRLASLLNLQQWSYLEYVPQRYGVSECLTAATNCLLAKAHAVLAPKEESFAVCTRLYGKALRALQDALLDNASAMDADVLCATQLLSLHELLDPARDTAWSHHVQGSARLVRHRSATRFISDYERALFAAHVGGIVSECLINNTHCYLEQPEWIDLYTSLTMETNFLNERSPLCIKLRVAMFSLPGLWHEIGEAVNSDDFSRGEPISSLETRCRKAHMELLEWLDQYKAHCVRLSLAQPPATELSLRRELFGSALECMAIVKRLLCTVCELERRALEVETQALAHLILDLQKQPSPKHSWLFSGHEVGVAYTVLLTKDQWEEDVSRRDPEGRKLATRTRYNTWSNTLRMTG